MPTIKFKRTLSISVVSIAIALSAGLSGCSKSGDAKKLIEDAKQYEQKGDHKAAVIQLKNALQKTPDDAEARYLLGTIYNQTGDAVSAEKEIRKAVSLGMSSAKVLPDLAKSLLAQGQFQKLIDETQGGDARKDAGMSAMRGSAFMALGKAEDARQSFDMALQDKADYPDALIGLAKLKLGQKDIDGAMQLAEQAVVKNPESTEAWLFKGDLLRAQNKADDALAAYNQVLKIKPGYATAHIAKAYVEISSKKFVEAQADIDAAKKSAPNGLMVFYTQALLDFSQKKYPAALESLQQVLRSAPEHMPSVLLAGAVQYALGSTQQAEQHLKKYLEQNPGNLYARKLLAATLLKSGQTLQAIATLEPALKSAVKDAHLYMLAGESYMQAKDFGKATEYFEQANLIAPGTASVHTALGMSKLGQGDNERAIAELEKAASMDAKAVQPGIILIMTHMRMKEFDKALAAAQKLEKEQPDNPIVHNLKGGVYLGKKETANARASFEKAISLQPTYFAPVQNLAQLDFQNKQPEAAKKRFEAFLDNDKKNLQAMLALAGLALAQGKNDETKTWLERASNEHPNEIQPASLLVGHYIRVGDKKQALNLATKLQSSHPETPEFLGLLAETQLANDEKAAALDTYNKLAVLQPDSAAVQYRVASLNLGLQNEAAGTGALKKALQIDPGFVAAKLALAGIEVKKGNYDEALAIARQLQKQHSKLALGHVLEGDIWMAQKKPALAVTAYERAAEFEKNGLLAMKMHGALLQAGRDKDAGARLSQWLKESPSDHRTRMYLANHNLVSHQNKAAIEQLQLVIQAEPKNVLALNNLAWAMSEEKDPRALGYAEQAYQLAGENPAVLDTLGWMLVQKGDTARGLPMLQKAVGLAPNISDIRYHLVLALTKSGDKAAARKELQQLLANPQNFGKIDEAKALLKQL